MAPQDLVVDQENKHAHTATITLPDHLPRATLGVGSVSENYWVQEMSTLVPHMAHDTEISLGVKYTVASHMDTPFAAAGSLAVVTYDRRATTWGPTITMPNPSLTGSEEAAPITFFTGVITDEPDPFLPFDTERTDIPEVQSNRRFISVIPAILVGILMALPLIGFFIWWRFYYRKSQSYKQNHAARLAEAKGRAAVRAAEKAKRVAVQMQKDREKEEREKQDKARAQDIRMKNLDKYGGTDDPEFAKYGRI